MPAVAPVPPEKFKMILEHDGWTVHDQDAFHWVMTHPNFDQPCLIPKDTDLVAVDLMMSLFRKSGWSLKSYFEVVTSEDLATPFVN